jgi:hypothetical protein
MTAASILAVGYESTHLEIGDLFGKRGRVSKTKKKGDRSARPIRTPFQHPAADRSRSRQYGRASAPMIPQRLHTMRGPNVGTGKSSGHGSALKIARWWHCQQHTSSDRTPLARMLPRVIGGPA